MIKRVGSIFVVLIVLVLFAKSAGAVEINKGLFDSKVRYDIYLRNSESDYTAILSVEIVRVEEILGRKFLVIRPTEFTLNSADGFVSFDAIQAILPSHQIKVKSGAKLNVTY